MNKCLARHLLVTCLALILCILIFELTALDMQIQQLLYNQGSHQWWWDKQEFWARLLFYDGIKVVLLVFFLSLLLMFVVSFIKHAIKPLRPGLLIVMLSMLSVPATVGLLKATTNMACPVNLLQFGGKVEHVPLFSAYPADKRPAAPQKCFPAGHASGGFSLLALIFLMPTDRARQWAIVGALSLGWLMGGYKMLIGDHFLSHTLVSMLLSWGICCLNAALVYRFYPAPTNLWKLPESKSIQNDAPPLPANSYQA
ncbi:phosphatase PAP2 family protein [Bowmanella denitrificans]|uniref:phosphatase PAP2 family protein n=1 Tax=Bowmanella denitrificans TaxID=366582 RepID=UPI0015590327|nr:phosphatase PAP2 family protein [Bowmanella denitrificans]